MGSILFYAVVFWLIYTIFSKFKANNSSFSSRKKLSQDEAKYLVALLAKVAKGDGRVNELEARLVSETLDDIVYQTGAKRDELKLIFNYEKERVSDAYNVAREYRKNFNLDSQTAIARLTFFLNLAYIDGEFLAEERAVIQDIANGFGIDNDVLNRVIYRFENFYSSRNEQRSRYENKADYNQSRGAKNPYEVLEISSSASFNEIKKRYRELVKKYHPDILMGQGESEAVIEKSTKKLQEINEAYEIIKKERGEN